MRICLDASPAVHGRAGLGRYVQDLAAALVEHEPDLAYSAFYNRASAARPQPPLDRLQAIKVESGDKPWRLRTLVSHLAQRPQARLFPAIDLFHGTDNLLPFVPGIATTFTLFDLAFRLYPETVSRLNRWFLLLGMPRFLRCADRIIAISECSKADAVRLYAMDPERIDVIHNGVHPRFRPAGPNVVSLARAKYGLPDRYLLFVGTVEPRKNLTVLLEALACLRESRRDPQWVIVGRRGWLADGFYRRLAELGLQEQVVFPGFVPDEDLSAIYSGADLFVFPSLYEGFGLPILEAMACGAPVACSNTSSLPEVAGDAAMLVPATDARAWAAAIDRATADRDLRLGMSARGLAHVAGFTWRRTAEQTAGVYRECVMRRRGERQS